MGQVSVDFSDITATKLSTFIFLALLMALKVIILIVISMKNLFLG